MRRLLRCVALALVALSVAACGQADPVVLAVSMPDCITQGPSAMRTGNVRVSLTLNGLADSGVALVELTGEEGYQDLVRHFEGADLWEDRPSWVSPLVELRLDPSQALDGVEETTHLDEGRYALVCIHHAYDGSPATARAAAPVDVRA